MRQNIHKKEYKKETDTFRRIVGVSPESYAKTHGGGESDSRRLPCALAGERLTRFPASEFQCAVAVVQLDIYSYFSAVPREHMVIRIVS